MPEPRLQDRQSNGGVGRVCAGCGTLLPSPKRASGQQQKWCSGKCRKATLYAGSCIDCGAPTDGSNGRAAAPERCLECRARYQHETRHWTAERILDAIRRWDALYGVPPTATDWNVAQARQLGRFDRVDRYLGGNWPALFTVTTEFGSWNAAIGAAGFEPLGVGKRRKVAA